MERQDERMLSARDVWRQSRVWPGLADQVHGGGIECRNAARLKEPDINQTTIARHRHSQDDGALLGCYVANELLMLRKNSGDLPQVVILGFTLAILARRICQRRRPRCRLGIGGGTLRRPGRQGRRLKLLAWRWR